MNPQEVIAIGQEAMLVTALVAAPALLVALAVGLAVSVLQAATQINEMTLSFIPKLVAILVTLVVTGPWMLATLTDYTARMFGRIAALGG
jgi:flagellar biosynthetic protein FliQ